MSISLIFPSPQLTSGHSASYWLWRHYGRIQLFRWLLLHLRSDFFLLFCNAIQSVLQPTTELSKPVICWETFLIMSLKIFRTAFLFDPCSWNSWPQTQECTWQTCRFCWSEIVLIHQLYLDVIQFCSFLDWYTFYWSHTSYVCAFCEWLLFFFFLFHCAHKNDLKLQQKAVNQ